MQQLLLILPVSEKAALGSVRCMPGLFAAEENNLLYIKCPDENVDVKIKQLPVLHTYILNDPQFLFPLQGQTPVGKLQSLAWQPLNQFIQPELPVAAMPGRQQGKVAIKVIPSQNVQAGSAVFTTLAAWQGYASTAPEARLQCTRFAVSEAGEVLVMGNPLPPLKGSEYWMVNNLLIPAGYAFELTVMYQLATEILNPNRDAFLLFDTNGQYEQIPVESFVAGNRSGIRLTNTDSITT